jgi:hypothetical protein
VKASCAASVGEASRVNCEGAAKCDVVCKGACDVDCADGHCRVQCADPATCNVSCGKGPAATQCADPSIKVCGTGC